MKIEILKFTGIVFGATRFWKVTELLLQYRVHKRFKKAEICNLDVHTDNLLLENWLQWPEKMEKRVQELECKNTQMNETIIKQRERINELKKYVDQLEREIHIQKN